MTRPYCVSHRASALKYLWYVLPSAVSMYSFGSEVVLPWDLLPKVPEIISYSAVIEMRKNLKLSLSPATCEGLV